MIWAFDSALVEQPSNTELLFWATSTSYGGAREFECHQCTVDHFELMEVLLEHVIHELIVIQRVSSPVHDLIFKVA